MKLGKNQADAACQSKTFGRKRGRDAYASFVNLAICHAIARALDRFNIRQERPAAVAEVGSPDILRLTVVQLRQPRAIQYGKNRLRRGARNSGIGRPT